MSRKLLLLGLLSALICPLSDRHADATVYRTASVRWMSDGGSYPNGPLLACEVSEWSHCDTDGWNATSQSCVRRHYGRWNTVPSCEYSISDADYDSCGGASVDWGVGATSQWNWLAETDYTAYDNPTYTDQFSHTVHRLQNAWVVFDEGRKWVDDYGNQQPEVQNSKGVATEYRIDCVTAHEAGHVAGIDGHSLSSSDLMYATYPHNNGSLSTSNDYDTLRDLYDVRQFTY